MFHACRCTQTYNIPVEVTAHHSCEFLLRKSELLDECGGAYTNAWEAEEGDSWV